MSFNLDYDQLIHLDAEDLAETGIGSAYERMLPELRKRLLEPAEVEELIDNDAPSYSIRFKSKEFVIYGPDDGYESWGRATVAFFAVINDQLAATPYLFYAVNGGNDLGGMFLTPDQAEAAREKLPNESDWPYLPVDDPPRYGMREPTGG
jgi:hypothetical protein